MTLDLTDHASIVAPRLLGSLLIGPNGSGRIVEVEAYGGSEDAASHAYRGPTERSQTMFGPAGRLYVYLIYGMHHCANVVTGADGDGQAVLIRALEPVGDREPLRRARSRARRDRDLCNGPGKLCEALGITRADDGTPLEEQRSRVRLVTDNRREPPAIGQTTRVGISVAQERPWRWYVRDSEWVSPGGPKDEDHA